MEASTAEVYVVAVCSHEAVVVVDGVRVRWNVPARVPWPSVRWRCDEHGESTAPTCWHAAAAAARIAEELLGLPAEVTTTTKEKNR